MTNVEIDTTDMIFLRELHFLGCDIENYLPLNAIFGALNGKYDVMDYLRRLKTRGYVKSRNKCSEYALTSSSIDEAAGIADIPLDEKLTYDPEEGE